MYEAFKSYNMPSKSGNHLFAIFICYFHLLFSSHRLVCIDLSECTCALLQVLVGFEFFRAGKRSLVFALALAVVHENFRLGNPLSSIYLRHPRMCSIVFMRRQSFLSNLAQRSCCSFLLNPPPAHLQRVLLSKRALVCGTCQCVTSGALPIQNSLVKICSTFWKESQRPQHATC